MILLLLALIVVGLLIMQQINRDATPVAEQAQENAGSEAPTTPRGPEDLKDLKDQLNSLIKDSKSERDERIDQESRK